MKHLGESVTSAQRPCCVALLAWLLAARCELMFTIARSCWWVFHAFLSVCEQMKLCVALRSIRKRRGGFATKLIDITQVPLEDSEKKIETLEISFV